MKYKAMIIVGLLMLLAAAKYRWPESNVKQPVVNVLSTNIDVMSILVTTNTLSQSSLDSEFQSGVLYGTLASVEAVSNKNYSVTVGQLVIRAKEIRREWRGETNQ